MGGRPKKKPTLAPGDELHEIEAAVLLRMSPELLKWFTEFAPKSGQTRKLPSHRRDGMRFYTRSDLIAFDAYLHEPWPIPASGSRPTVPVAIKNEIIIEAQCGCAVCCHGDDGEIAHITPVSESRSNHPHNLIFLCPNHHTRVDNGIRPHVNLATSLVRLIKDTGLNRRVREWEAQRGACRASLRLIHDLERIRAAMADPTNAEAAAGLGALAKASIEQLNKITSYSSKIQYLDAPRKVEDYRAFARQVASTTDTPDNVSAVVDAVVAARTAFLGTGAEEVACPVCATRDLDGRSCPACGDLLVVSAERAANLRENDYAAVDCPVCGGSGIHDERNCAACGGGGWLFEFEASELDLSPYEEVDCPICGGSGELDERACTACGRSGAVMRQELATLDARDFADVRCPLCSGSGKHELRESCPVCDGAGIAPKDVVDRLDVGQYHVVGCARCAGAGSIAGTACRTCHGNGVHERGPR